MFLLDSIHQWKFSRLYMIHCSRSRCRHPSSESPASDTELYSFNNRDPVWLQPCPGCIWWMIISSTFQISPEVEQRCPGADYRQGRNPVLVCRGRQILSDSSAKGIQLQHPSFRCIPLFWSPRASVRSEVTISTAFTSVQDILPGCQVVITHNALVLKYHTGLCAPTFQLQRS